MRYLIYLLGLAAILYVVVLFIQIFLKRLAAQDLVRRSDLEDMKATLLRRTETLLAVSKHCEAALLVNDSDLTALHVVRIINQGEKPA